MEEGNLYELDNLIPAYERLEAEVERLTQERDMEQQARLTEVEHWVTRYNELETWRAQTFAALLVCQQERDAWKLAYERVFP